MLMASVLLSVVKHSSSIIRTGVLACLIAVASIVSVVPARADEIESEFLNASLDCEVVESTTFSGTITVPSDEYDVYARLPSRGQTAAVSAYGQVDDTDGECKTIGSTVELSGDRWTLVGQLSSLPDEEGQPITNDAVLALASDDLNNLLGANRPSIMLISQTHPVCEPDVECTVTINDQEGFVRPIGTLPNEDSLHIVRPIDPTQDTIKQVVYYVDNEPVYTTKTLQPFDLRYVAQASQVQSRVIEYASGQRVVLNHVTPNDFGSNFQDFLFRLVNANPRLLITVGIIAGLAIIAGITMGIIHTIVRHREWRVAHGFIQERVRILTDAERRKEFLAEHRNSIIKQVVLGVIGLIGILIVVVGVSNYIITPFKVDGHSMENTYKDQSMAFINKVPVTLAHIAGHDYSPQRGQAVVVREIFGITDDVNEQSSEGLYLIKRVIGLPGERVVVSDGVITVYNSKYPEGFTPDSSAKWEKTMIIDDGTIDSDVTLGTDELFIAGDNRPVSIDSRFNGPILTKQIVGIVLQ